MREIEQEKKLRIVREEDDEARKRKKIEKKTGNVRG